MTQPWCGTGSACSRSWNVPTSGCSVSTETLPNLTSSYIRMSSTPAVLTPWAGWTQHGSFKGIQTDTLTQNASQWRCTSSCKKELQVGAQILARAQLYSNKPPLSRLTFSQSQKHSFPLNDLLLLLDRAELLPPEVLCSTSERQLLAAGQPSESALSPRSRTFPDYNQSTKAQILWSRQITHELKDMDT